MTMRAAVLGHPVRHSLSPLIHRYWLDQLGLDGQYEKIDVAPEGLADCLGRLEREGFRGVNCTIPLKEPALALLRERSGLDRISPVAAAIGAVNTLVFPDAAVGGGRFGDNTDVFGFHALRTPDQLHDSGGSGNFSNKAGISL